MGFKINYALSTQQKGLWIIWQQDKTNPLYNLRLTYHIKGELDYNNFQKSLDILFRNNPALYSTFHNRDGVPYAEISQQPSTIAFQDFTGIPEEDRKERIFSFLGKESRVCFDLEKGPLYRLYLIKENDLSHFFHMSVHHIIFDGISEKIFLEQLSNNYCKLSEGLRDEDLDSVNLPDLNPDDGISAGEEASLVKFWKESLAGVHSYVKFPADFNFPVNPSGFGHKEHFLINSSTTGKLRTLAEEEGSSLYRTIVAAIGIFVGRYSGDTDFCLGIPVSKRYNNPDLTNAIGFYVDTVPARISVKGKACYRDHIAEAKKSVSDAIKNSKLPFEKIVQVVKPERISNVNPLFQIAISSFNGIYETVKLGQATAEPVIVPEDVAPFNITFYIWENGNTVEGDLNYNTDIFKNSTIKRLLKNFLFFVDGLADNPGKPVSEVSLVSDDEANLLRSFNLTEASFPDLPVHELIEKRALTSPGKTALISGPASYTYKELNEKSNQVARYLRANGINEGDVVGVCLERSAEMVIYILGILKAGCAYLPVDISYPAERIGYMLKDSNASLLISQYSLHEKLGGIASGKVLYSDNPDLGIFKEKSDNLNTGLTGDSLAYLIYTSGSTGNPKGVMVHHRAVVNMINSMSARPGMTDSDVLLAVVTPAFDMSVYEIFTSLSAGATIVVAGQEDLTDGVALSTLIEKHNITILQATPSLWNILLEKGWTGKKDLKALSGGEPLTIKLAEQLITVVGELWNCYGPTETTVYATCGKITDPDLPITIGKPLDNTHIYILDNNNQQVPCGVSGEVAIGGICVTKGYLNLPAMTSERFIRIPAGETVYKTGDFGKLLDSGDLEFFGRIDNQIKLRGYRIEPAEIETLLSKIKGINNAVVKIEKFGEGDDRLVAFLEVDHGFSLSETGIKASLAKRLPAYMMPSFYQYYEKFPRLSNGKINKKELIFDHKKAADDDIKHQEMSSTEAAVYQVWKDILKTDNISVTDNFFFLGGNSLLAISACSLIEKKLNIELGLKTFFYSPCIKDIANAIDLSDQNTGKPNITGEFISESNIVKGEI